VEFRCLKREILNHAIQLISQMSGSEVAVWNNRDTSSGGYKGNHKGERATTKRKGRLTMRAPTSASAPQS